MGMFNNTLALLLHFRRERWASYVYELLVEKNLLAFYIRSSYSYLYYVVYSLVYLNNILAVYRLQPTFSYIRSNIGYHNSFPYLVVAISCQVRFTWLPYLVRKTPEIESNFNI